MKTYSKTLEEEIEKFLIACEIKGKIGEMMFNGLIEKIRKGVVDSILTIRPKDIEGEARYHDSYNDGKRDVLDDLLAQLKD